MTRIILTPSSGSTLTGTIYQEADKINIGRLGVIDIITVDLGGNVGIGQTSPDFKLSLNGGMRIENSSSSPDTGSGTEYGYNASTNEAFQITRTKGVGTSTYRPFIHRAEYISFQTGTTSTTERLKIDSSGNSTFAGQVNITKSGGDHNLVLTNNTAGGDFIKCVGETGDTVFLIDSTGTGGEATLQMFSDGVLKNTISANGDSYFNGGNVGVGTSLPQMGLHVADTKGALFGPSGSGTSSAYFSPSDENTLNGSYGKDDDAGDIWLNYRGYQDGFTRFRDTRIGNGKGGLVAIFDGSSGNVGVGTSTFTNFATATQLLVKGDAVNSNSIIQVISNDSNSSLAMYSGSSTSDDPLLLYQNDLRFGSATNIGLGGYTERMRITSGGDFGFNETTITNPYGQTNFTDLNIDGTWGGVISFKLGGVEKGWIGQRNSGNSDMVVGASAGQDLNFNTDGNNTRMVITSVGILQKNGTSTEARIIPETDNAGYLGQSTKRWSAVYAVTGTIQTSDVREKTEIIPTQLGLDFVNDLNPVSYKWIKNERLDASKDKRSHQGLIAQEVAETLEKHGVNKNDFGGLDIQKTDKYDDFHGMSYEQLVAPMIKAIQELKAEVDLLKSNKCNCK